MSTFRTRPNLSNLQFRQIAGTELDLEGVTKVLEGGQIRITEDGELVMECDPRGIHEKYHPFIKADENGVLYKEFLDISGLTFTIFQPNHGFHVGDVIGFEEDEPNGVGKYTKAIADGSYPGEPLGLASQIIDDDYFVLMQVGFTTFNETDPYFDNINKSYLLNLTPGKIYYLSADSAGDMVIEPPSDSTHIRKPVFLPTKDYITGETNRGWVLPYPPIDGSLFTESKTLYFIGDDFNKNFDLSFLSQNHGFNTRNVSVQIYRDDPPYSDVHLKVERNESNGELTIKFSTPPGNDERFKVLVSKYPPPS